MPLPGNNEAGWEFNDFYKVDNPYGGQGESYRMPRPPAQADLIGTDSLVVAPFFAPFGDMACHTMNLPFRAEASATLGKSSVQMEGGLGRNEARARSRCSSGRLHVEQCWSAVTCAGAWKQYGILSGHGKGGNRHLFVS